MSASPPRDAAAILGEAARSLQNVGSLAEIVERAAAVVAQSLRDGGRVFFCGNGGSSADSQHLAGEFLGRFLVERPSWAAISTSGRSPNVLKALAAAREMGIHPIGLTDARESPMDAAADLNIGRRPLARRASRKCTS